MLKRSSFLLQALLVGSLGVLLGWGVSRVVKGQGQNAQATDGKYDYDSHLEAVPTEAQLADGQKLALVIGMSKSSQVPEYLGVLQRKYSSQGLKLLVAVPSDAPQGLGNLTEALGVPFIIDSDGRLQRFLRFASNHGHNAVLIYDDAYRVKFHLLGMPDNDQLRQLVEKYLVGRITYEPTELAAASLIGRKLDGLQCLIDPPPSTGVFVVFPPACSSCELNSYRAALKRAREDRESGKNWTLVFVNGRDAHVLAQARDLGFDEKQVCGVRDDVLFDPYQTRKGSATVPILVRTDSAGTITGVSKLTDFETGGQR